MTLKNIKIEPGYVIVKKGGAICVAFPTASDDMAFMTLNGGWTCAHPTEVIEIKGPTRGNTLISGKSLWKAKYIANGVVCDTDADLLSLLQKSEEPVKVEML